MSVKSLVKIEGYFYVIFTQKTRQKPHFTSIFLRLNPQTIQVYSYWHRAIIKIWSK